MHFNYKMSFISLDNAKCTLCGNRKVSCARLPDDVVNSLALLKGSYTLNEHHFPGDYNR